MPKWRLHNYWARKMYIPEKLSNEVNYIIDISGVHDGREDPETFLEDAKKSYELGQYSGLKTFFLHHFLDRLEQRLLGNSYREAWDKTLMNDEAILKRTIIDAKDWLRYFENFNFIEKYKVEKALDEVVAFVQKNYEKIVKDIKEDIK